MSEPFDLPAYLNRIGVAEVPSLDADGLLTLQRGQRLNIPFENLDILLGRGISLDSEHIFDKLVRQRRGGYCFEQNGLFLGALREAGFTARPLLARVWLFANGTPPKTHMINLVTVGDEEWIADAGFGGSYTPPMRLAEHEVVGTDGISHRLIRHDELGWMLERSADNGETWSPQYSFTTAKVWPADIALSNHFVSTEPGGRFTSNAIASIVLPNGFASIVNRDYSRSSAKGDEASEIASAKMFQLRLSLVFGIDLSNGEIEALGLF
jgi:N-hydroxyarylamine O-acetyltransferase